MNMFNKYAFLKKPLFYAKVIGVPILWYNIGLYNRDDIRKNFYDKGLRTSQMFKPIPMWDNYAEPFVIKQFSILFTAGNSFIDGMVSDNENKDYIKKKVDEMKHSIDDDIKKNTKKLNNKQ